MPRRNLPARTPNPTLYVMLHDDAPQLDIFANPTDTQALGPNDEIHVEQGGQIDIIFFNNADANVLTGLLKFSANDASNSPFETGEVTAHSQDNLSGRDKNHIPSESSVRIPANKSLGRYPFTVNASWKGGSHHVGSDPIVVIEKLNIQ